jgi:hypothetical protein
MSQCRRHVTGRLTVPENENIRPVTPHRLR